MKELKVRLPVHMLPPVYTCDGKDKSPPLEIYGIDNSVSKSLSLVMNGPGVAGCKVFVHWIMWNMELVFCPP